MTRIAVGIAAVLLCWIQPEGPPASSYVLEISGVRVPISATSSGPDVSPDGVIGNRWCASVPALWPFRWALAAVASDGELVWGSNSPLLRWGPDSCRSDLDGNGAVGLADVSATLARLGGACEIGPQLP